MMFFAEPQEQLFSAVQAAKEGVGRSTGMAYVGRYIAHVIMHDGLCADKDPLNVRYRHTIGL